MNIIISNTSGIPIYEQISNSVKENIINGVLEDNSPLPSIRALASDLRVSVITTKRAYEELEKEGYIYTLPGKGSFVSPKNQELIRENKLQELEKKLMEAIDISNLLGFSTDELIEILKTLKEL